MNKTQNTRLTLVSIMLSMASVLVLLMMVRIQNSAKYQELSIKAESEYSFAIENYVPERGNIYDRWGRLIAGNEDVYEVGLLLENVMSPKTIAQTLDGVNELEYYEILQKASQPYDPKFSVYSVLTDFLPSGVIDALSQIYQDYELENPYGRKPNLPSLRGIVWYPHLKRNYPENSLASNVIGFYSFQDRSAGEGYFGVEEYYDDLLAGRPMETFMHRNPYMLEELPEVPAGASLVLTIDREIQAMVEKKLDEAVKENEAESGTVVILDPRNGEILAMASQPRINLNQYWQFKDEFDNDRPFNRAVGAVYEPGSVFKVLTMAAAYDDGTVDDETTYYDSGRFEYYGATILNWNRRGNGEQTMQGCMQKSLNVCLAWVATEMGADSFYNYMQAFGIGRRSNIDLGGEEIYPLSTPDDLGWYPIQLVTNSFGQGVAVNPVQIATAISAVANDGKMMKPHVLKAVIQNGKQYNTTPQVLGVPIKAETAQTMTSMLVKSLEEESSSALVPGYSIAGKTGTAEIATDDGAYGTELTNASFVGWGPAADPQFLVYVWIEKPQSSPWGSVVAAPIFSSIVQELVVYLDLPPEQVVESQIAMGN